MITQEFSPHQWRIEDFFFFFFFYRCKVEERGDFEVLEKRESIGERGIEGRMEESHVLGFIKKISVNL
jgi:hypothetical protein